MEYGEDVLKSFMVKMPRTQIFEKRIEKGRKEMEDDPKTGRPSTTRTDENITRVKQLVQSDGRLTVRISDELSLNRESVRILI